MIKYILFLVLSFQVFAQKTTTNFDDSSWTIILTKAKDTNKPIYVDFYTTWCGPCKLMENQFFTDVAIAKLLNSNFINVRIDAEAGEGIALAKLYNVDAYPSSFFLTSEGLVFHRMIGYPGVQSGKVEIENALKKYESVASKSLDVLDNEFKTNKSLGFVKEYFSRKIAAKHEIKKEKDAFFESLNEKDVTKSEVLKLLVASPVVPETKLFSFLVDKMEKQPLTLPLETHGAILNGIKVYTEQGNLENDFNKIMVANGVEKKLVLFQKAFFNDRNITDEKVLSALDDQLKSDILKRDLEFYLINNNFDMLNKIIDVEYKLIETNKKVLKRKDEQHTLAFLEQNKKLSSDVKNSSQFKNFLLQQEKYFSKKSSDQILFLAGFLSKTNQRSLIKKAVSIALTAHELVATEESFNFLIKNYDMLNYKKKSKKIRSQKKYFQNLNTETR